MPHQVSLTTMFQPLNESFDAMHLYFSLNTSIITLLPLSLNLS